MSRAPNQPVERMAAGAARFQNRELLPPVETIGVVSKPKTRFTLFLARLFARTQRETGYVVDASRAIEVLATHVPEAALWWRQHAPRAVAPGEYFLFAAEVCEEVTR